MTEPKTEQMRNRRAAGVQDLIDRLREEGIKAGRDEAETIRKKAEAQASAEVEKARLEAERIVEDAKRKAEQLRTAGEEALRTATRDTVLRFSEELMVYLRTRVERLVSEEMVDRKLLQQLIAQVASRPMDEPVVREADEVKVYVPARPLGVDELKNDPEALHDELSRLVKQIAGSTWREGVTFHAFGASEQGIKVVVEEGGLVVDLSPEAVTELLMLHLRPRFRALLQGIIQ